MVVDVCKMISKWLLLLFYLRNIHSRELSLQCWRCEVAVQSSEATGVFLDDCRAQFDFTQHTREDCDGKCWKSADLIDIQLLGNTTGNGSFLINAALSTFKSSRRCFSADELLRAAEKGINTSNGCRKVERDDKKTKEISTTHGCGVRSPAIIYSCLIKNNSDAEIDVKISFAGIEDHHSEIADIQIAKDEEQRIDEKEFEHGESSGKYHKTVESICVRRYDGSKIELKKPFDGVNSPKKNWIFEITNDSIKSVDPEK